jgi:hypothetical protein
LLGSEGDDLSDKSDTTGDRVEDEGFGCSVGIRVVIVDSAEGSAELGYWVAEPGVGAQVVLRVSYLVHRTVGQLLTSTLLQYPKVPKVALLPPWLTSRNEIRLMTGAETAMSIRTRPEITAGTYWLLRGAVPIRRE